MPSCAQQPHELQQCLTLKNTKGKWGPLLGCHRWRFLREQHRENQGEIALHRRNHSRTVSVSETQTHQELSCQDSARWAPESWTLIQRVWNDESGMVSG